MGGQNMNDAMGSTLDRRELLAWTAGAVLAATGADQAVAAASDAPDGAPAGLRLKRIDNMDIYTKDVPRLVEFYTGTLGLKFFLPYEPDKRWAAIDFGNLTLYVFEANLGE